MTETQNAPAAITELGQIVHFREGFSDVLFGLDFIIDGLPRMGADGKETVGIKIKNKRGWCFRLAYVTDLIEDLSALPRR